MSSTARSLFLTTSLYFAALGTVAAGLYGGLTTLAPAVQGYFLHDGQRVQSRADVMVANAREIREALAKPIPPPAPLPPITAARPQHAMAKAESRVSSRRLSAEARDAYAMSQHAGGGVAMVVEDRHRPQ